MRDPQFRIKIEDSEGNVTTHFLTLREIMGWQPQGKPILIEQYSEFTDKNDQKIYEGDSVKVTHIIEAWEYIGEVRFVAGRFYVHDNTYHPSLDNAGHIYEVLQENPK